MLDSESAAFGTGARSALSLRAIPLNSVLVCMAQARGRAGGCCYAHAHERSGTAKHAQRQTVSSGLRSLPSVRAQALLLAQTHTASARPDAFRLNAQ
jgi:hypothetical protein